MTETQQNAQEQPQVLHGLLSCPKCGTSNAVGTRYCENCGKSLVGLKPSSKEMEAFSSKPGFFGRLFGRK